MTTKSTKSRHVITVEVLEDTLYTINLDIMDYYEKKEISSRVKDEISLASFLLSFDVLPGYLSSYGVKFMGEYIWHSEADDRQYEEDTDSYEDFEIHLRNKIKNILEFWSNLKV